LQINLVTAVLAASVVGFLSFLGIVTLFALLLAGSVG
jgi:hypothetical protein